MGNFYYNLQGGLNTQLTPVLMGAESKIMYWADGFNVEPYKNQGITRQKGNQLLLKLAGKIPPRPNKPESLAAEGSIPENTQEPPESDLSAVMPVGACAYPKGVKNFILALSDGRIFYFKDDLSTLNLIYDFERDISDYVFEYFLDGIVILPKKYTGSAIDGIYYNIYASEKVGRLNFKNSRGEVILASSVCQYAGRLWISSESTLYYSALGTYNDWSSAHDAGYISNFHSSTEKIVALKEYGGSLAIYKEFEVFLLTGNDPETFAIVKFADKGTGGQSSVLTCNNKQYFFNDCGLFSLSLAGELSQIVMSQNRAKNITELFKRLDKSRIQEVVMLALELKNQIWIFPPIAGEKEQKEVWIYDWALDSWFIRIIPYEIITATTVLDEIYTISPDDGGKIFIEDKGNTFSGKPIKFSISTPFFNFSKPTVKKIIEDFEIVCDGNSDNCFYFSVSTDYLTENRSIPDYIFTYSPDILVWEGVNGVMSETFWADENTGGIWAENLQENLKLDIFDSNKSVQLHFYGDEAGQEFTIIGFEFKGIIYDE